MCRLPIYQYRDLSIILCQEMLVLHYFSPPEKNIAVWWILITIYLNECKRYLKSRFDEHKRSVTNCGCDTNEIAKHCWQADYNFSWDQKKVIDRESRLIPIKMKETIHSLKNPNHISKISYILPEIWLPNLHPKVLTNETYANWSLLHQQSFTV